MLVKLISRLINLCFKNEYNSKTIIISEIISVYITLVIYWFTSKAFSGAVSLELKSWGGSYFSYLFVGEVFLILPTFLIMQFASNIKLSLQNKTFDTFMHLPIGQLKSIMVLGLVSLPSVMWHIFIMLSMGYLFFGFNLGIMALIKILLLQIASIPCFLGLGYIGTSFLIRFGRGEGVLNYLCIAGSFFSGAFFPLSTLPPFFSSFGPYISPFSALMIYTRKISTSVMTVEDWRNITFIFGIMIILYFFIGLIFLMSSLKSWKKSDENIVFSKA